MSRAAASALKLRQSLFLSAVLKSSQERKASATLFSVISVIPRSPAAVSYTHLDVYKRQFRGLQLSL